jgi:hypothetical protein
MRHALPIVTAALCITGASFATISSTLAADSYTFTENGTTYSAMDVYVVCGAPTDILSSVFGVNAFNTAFSATKSFVHTGGSSWAPTNDDGRQADSFVTAGARNQGSDLTLAGGKAGFVKLSGDTNFTNFTTAGAGSIEAAAGSQGAGWYPTIGASTSTNPYAKASYGTAGSVAKATGSIAGNNVNAGQSLENYWMVGHFVIEASNAAETFRLKFAIAGKNNGVVTVTGATNTAYRYDSTFTFASVPAPGAIALMGLAGMIGDRRRKA